jgi:hypothetical protein
MGPRRLALFDVAFAAQRGPGPIIVLATLAPAHNILLEAGLSVLGLGVDPEHSSGAP